MKLPLLNEALRMLPNYTESGDGGNVYIQCPFCGGSASDPHSLSIKVDVKPGEPMVFQCFRASCGESGALTTAKLQDIGIRDLNVISELARYNQTVSKNMDASFVVRNPKDIVLVNLPVGNSAEKLKYLNNRLGVNFKAEDLSKFKIQLSLLDMLRINDIKRLAVSKNSARALDQYCIGFISMYYDYMICRDVTPDNKTGMRYYTYRIAGKPDPDDIKIYCIPTEIDIMDSRSAVINIAEGPFSILGAYLNTDLGRERRNSIWLANCGAQYMNTILRVCKQYGLLKVHINIWSDSEIKAGAYRKLYSALKNRLDIRKFVVYYNSKFEDFGTSRKNIDIQELTIFKKGE